MPRLQFAMLALGLTGLCLGAIVSEGKRSEENLRSSEADLQEAQRVARLGSWTVETATGKVTWTDELYRMLGFDPSVRVPSLAERERILAPESWKRMNEEFETLRTGIPFELEIETVRPNGSTGWILIRGAPKRDAYGDLIGLCGIAQDITERKQVEKQVEYLAYFDSLTGLPNRRLLQDRLAKAIAGAQRRDERIAVLFFDLDRFKIINASLGHAVGDLLLQQVAERLKKQMHEQDTVARMGGDEFVIVLNSIHEPSDGALVAERIVRSIAAEFYIQGRTLKVSCSLGISVFPEHGEDSETLMKNADAAMQGAKENGHNQFRFFTDEMNAPVVEHSTLDTICGRSSHEKNSS
jgi:diguanylate cyclase (GGDEF)-like protein/PAS domain S-box-containing protein